MINGARVVIIDLDHTVFDSAWRDAMLGPGVDWDEYHCASVKDDPVDSIVAMINALHAQECTIVAITGRNERYRKITNEKLLKHGVMVDYLIMRSDEDYRRSPEMKVAALQQHVDLRSVLFALDDRDDVIQAYRTLGITTLQVQHGRLR